MSAEDKNLDDFDELLGSLASTDKKEPEKKPTRKPRAKKVAEPKEPVEEKTTETTSPVDEASADLQETIVSLESRVAALELAFESKPEATVHELSTEPKKGELTFTFVNTGLTFLGEVREYGDVVKVNANSAEYAQIKHLVDLTPEKQTAKWGKVFFTLS